MADTVLAHIASSIAQKENVATDALAFILNRSARAREALAADIGLLADTLVPIAHVSTQVAVGDESRPDLVLRAGDGKLVGYVEAKFWAALTAAQPVEYLRRLSESGGGVLVMLAPERRLATLRAEVVERVRHAQIEMDTPGPWTLAGDDVRIAFMSWARLNATLSAAVVDDAAAASDVRQLAGLCARFESEGFIPLTREDIDDLGVPRRVLALANLVTDIVDAAVAEGLFDIRGVNPTHYLGGTGRYAKMARAGCWIGLTHWAWSSKGRSPIWMRFSPDAWGRADQLREILRPWASLDPPRAYLDDEDRSVRIPLLLRTGAEKDAVVADVIRQIRELDGLMAIGGIAPLSGGPQPDA